MYGYLKSLLLVIIFYSPLANANLFSLNEQQINHYLQQKVQVEDQLSLPGLLKIDYLINNINAKIGQSDPQRVELSANIQGVFQLLSDQFNGNIHLVIDTIPYYDQQKGEVYLTDMRILSWQGEPDQYMNQLQAIMPFLSEGLTMLFNRQPIYHLDEQDPKQLLIKKIAKAIRVEKGKIVLEGELL